MITTSENATQKSDSASWHVSKGVRRWLGSHNRHVKNSGEGARIVTCFLPKESSWLNVIEPKKWLHGKRKVVEPEGLLDAPMFVQKLGTQVPISCRERSSPQQSGAG
jgi:hypothetical protein